MLGVRCLLGTIALTIAHLALWFFIGFLIVVFHTNPPPPIPGRENTIEFSRFIIFAVVSLVVGGSWGACAYEWIRRAKENNV